ncbi:DgyrCDS3418 [Dimorphilus gyrociliatus]|nr:DgyrCDS3418 [Dimorphilus gyrociliatus]
MELIDNFDKTFWTKKETVDENGYEQFRIAQRVAGSENSFKYAVIDSEGESKQVVLRGAQGKKDPLTSIANLMMKIKHTGEERLVEGIIVDDECVIYVTV